MTEILTFRGSAYSAGALIRQRALIQSFTVMQFLVATLQILITKHLQVLPAPPND